MILDKFLCTVAVALPIVSLFALEAQAGCKQWSAAGNFKMQQGNGFKVRCNLTQPKGTIAGDCSTSTNTGEVEGTINSKGRFAMVVTWDKGDSVGEYTGVVNDDGDVEDGRTFDRAHPASWSTWENTTSLKCTKED